MTTFTDHGDINLSAVQLNSRLPDLLIKKQQILDAVLTHHRHRPKNMLFVGFSEFLLLDHHGAKISVTEASAAARRHLDSLGITYSYISIPREDLLNNSYDFALAGDEYFTYSTDDHDQRSLVSRIVHSTRGVVMTTLRDYKNQEYRDREFSIPGIIKNQTNTIFLEHHDWNNVDKESWTSMVYEIDQQTRSMTSHGPFARRIMYFKQLAKFSSDAGAKSFLVHKNLMNKGLTRKNYEHIITIET